MDEREIEALKTRIEMLKTLYAVLFGASLAMLVMEWTILGPGLLIKVMWALTLGGAVGTRLYRSSLVNKYNAAIAGPGRQGLLQ